jgi:hypothetical protein
MYFLASEANEQAYLNEGTRKFPVEGSFRETDIHNDYCSIHHYTPTAIIRVLLH